MAMQRGHAFKLMSPKAIVDVMSVILQNTSSSFHPAVTCENIEKPSAEIVAVMYQALSEFCFDMDIQQVKGRAAEVPTVGQFVEIFDEAMDIISIFKLARQLAFINRVEDFSLKDMWDPQTKRLRALLSGIINFCRYKESQTGIITTMKAEVQALDNVRLELVDKSNVIENELAQAQAQHSAELQDMWDAENILQEAKDTVDKLQKQRQTADRMHEEADKKAQAAKEKLGQTEQRAEQLREHIASLQEQVADNPDSLERELQELQLAIRHQKSKVEEKSDEKRSRTQRVQVLGRLKTHVEQYKTLLDKEGEAAELQTTVCERTQAARSELACMTHSLEARRGEKVDVEQAVDQITSDMEAAKQAHEGQEQRYEEQRQQALGMQQELQEKRTEEQRQSDVLQAQRNALETEIANVKRMYEAEQEGLQAQLNLVQSQGEEYVQMLDGMMAQYNAEVGRVAPVAGRMLASPGSARAQRRSSDVGGFAFSPGIRASPSPRRLLH
jgi:myosin heavy subunit